MINLLQTPNLKDLCYKNNLKDQYVTKLKLKDLMCDQNNLKDQYVTNLKLKGPVI